MESVETTQKDSEHHHSDLRDLLEQTQNTLQQLNHIITTVLRRRPHSCSGSDEDFNQGSDNSMVDDSQNSNENDSQHGRESNEDMIVRGRSVPFQDAPMAVGRGKAKHRTPVNAATFVGVMTTRENPSDASSVEVPSVPATSSLPFHSFGKLQSVKNVRKSIVTKRPQSAGRGFIPASMMMTSTAAGRKAAAPGRLADILKVFHSQHEDIQEPQPISASLNVPPGVVLGELSESPVEASHLLQNRLKYRDVEASVANCIDLEDEGREKSDAFGTIHNVRSGGRGFIPFSKTAMDTLLKPPASNKKQPNKPHIGLDLSSTGQMQLGSLEEDIDQDLTGFPKTSDDVIGNVKGQSVIDLTASTEWMNKDDDSEDWARIIHENTKRTQSPGPDLLNRETSFNEPEEVPIDSKLPMHGSPILDLGSAEWMNSTEDDEDWARDVDTEPKHTQVSTRASFEEEERDQIENPTEIRNEEPALQPAAASAMVWDPESCRWIGNEEDMADFEFSDSEAEEDGCGPVAGTTKTGSAASSSWSIGDVDNGTRGDDAYEFGTSQPAIRKSEGKRDWERSDETIKSSAPLKKTEQKLNESNKKKKTEFEISSDDEDEPGSPHVHINRVSSNDQSRAPTEQEATFHISKEFRDYLFICEQAHKQAMLMWLSFIQDQENDAAAVNITPISESRKWAKTELQTAAV